MHFAALCSVDESVRKPELYIKNNVTGTLNLLEAMVEGKVQKIIFSSTCAVYGDAQYLPIDEKHPTKPLNPYGQSKFEAEKEIEKFGKLHGFNYVILRYFNVCGADSDGEIGDSKKPSELLVQNAVRGALGIEYFRLTCGKADTPDGTPIRDYIDVEDLVDAHINALSYLNKGKPSGIFNLGNGKGWSVKEIVNAVKKELGVEFVVKKGKERKGEYDKVYADIKKAKSLLDFNPKKTLADSVKSLVKWYNNKKNGYKK
ncbi:MAG: UDP-glucose 4-epimerase GalE [Candidatus Paceibacterota bacterium]|jgi:UDP-glucose 4-epimerase